MSCWPRSLKALAEQIGVALAGFRKLDDFIGDVREDGMSGLRNTESRARQFECDAHDALGLGVKALTIQKRSDWHWKRSLF
jgi:hypothetical protein